MFVFEYNESSNNSLNWKIYIQGFKSFLALEKSLSVNSIDAYLHDVEKLVQFLEYKNYKLSPKEIELSHLQEFLKWINELGMSAHSQARIISGIKGFYKYLLLENILNTDSTTLLEAPKLGRKLPDTLSLEEINAIIDAIDLSSPEGQRNKAMLETIYSCGLRVSELVNLKISHLYFNDEFIKVTGKGDKERLVPIGSVAIKQINIYKDQVRCHMPIKKDHEDYLFLNRRGAKLTRVMVFTIIKQLAFKIGLKKTHQSSYIQTFLCHTPYRRWSRFTRCARNARTRIHYHYRNLYPSRQRLSPSGYHSVSPSFVV